MCNEPILCFEHCQKGRRISCVAVPQFCPICQEDLELTPMRLPPFRLPSPFVTAQQAPFSVVVKPTQGDFLRDYEKSADLHIGVSNSKGVVYDYSSHGLGASAKGWEQCLAIPLLSTRDSRRLSWDGKLEGAVQQPAWTAKKYNEKAHNCYSFVLDFLRTVGLGDAYPCERLQFCQQVLLPYTSRAAQYIGLYRQILQGGCVVEGGSSSSTRM